MPIALIFPRFIDPSTGGPSSNLLDIETRHIVPVELNSYLCRSSAILRDLYRDVIKDQEKANQYQEHYVFHKD